MNRGFRRRPVVWRSDRRTVVEFGVLTLLVAALSLGAGLVIRGLGLGAATGQTVTLMAVAPPEVVEVAEVVEVVEVEAVGRAAEVRDVVAAVETSRADAAEAEVMAMPSPVVDGDVDATAIGGAAESTIASAPGESAAPMFNGRPLRKVKRLSMTVTAYSPDARSCGLSADGITASGYSVWTNGMKMVAADTELLPFGSIVTIPGYDGGKPVPVLDRGGAIKGRRLDVLYPTHEIALEWGVQKLDVTVWEYADE